METVKQGADPATRTATGSTIRVVAARTGLSMEALRAWERRYGFPSPKRREGSNRRLYDEEDVRKLIAIARALERGYRVGDVVDKSLEELSTLGRGANDSPAEVASAGEVPTLVDLLARDDASGLDGELRRLGAALGIRRFVTDVAHPFAVAVGVAWERGLIAVRHEHLATASLTTQLRSMLAGYRDLHARPRVLLTTLPGEPHALALDMVALYLAVSGATPQLLGASTPAPEIVDGVRALRADVVGITVGPTVDRAETVRGVHALLRGLPPGVPIWIGGSGADALDLDHASVSRVTSWSAIDRELAAWHARRPGAGGADR